ncbi:MAG TPA: thioesterase family protein [Bryobacteraceae bacterium]|nr:thioesterase family protein [Bryobacteraceae bacterium]
MPNIPIGTKGESKLLVTPELCINFLGVDSGRVFGTPWLIWHMELTARDSIKTLLGEGFDTVGTHVDVRHLAATPLGMEVTFHSEVIGVEERRIRFKVEAFDAREKIGEGLHERGVIHIERFASRVEAKAAEFSGGR